MRIDAHLHFWQPDCGFDNRPIADHPFYRRDFMPADVAPALAAARIDAAVLVQAAPQVAETTWLAAQFGGDPRFAAIVGWVDLDVAHADFSPLLDAPVVAGLRAQLRRIADDRFVTRPDVVRNLGRALAAGLGVTILAEPRHYDVLPPVLDALPPGPITFNHMGMANATTDRAAWRAALQRFARRPDSYLQCSGLPFLFGDGWRAPDVLSRLDEALDIFGPQRLLFASDWPMLLRFATYVEWVDAVESMIARRGLAAADRDAIFGGNVVRSLPRLAARVAAAPSPAPASTGVTP
ncbi:MAG: amidohydrolase family protein [Proteobacteria bacterium]|nr:amidohydrolase family protein [Pseudomonadota bacterium]